MLDYGGTYQFQLFAHLNPLLYCRSGYSFAFPNTEFVLWLRFVLLDFLSNFFGDIETDFTVPDRLKMYSSIANKSGSELALAVLVFHFNLFRSRISIILYF
ncbi:hypothetical protein SO802_016824 [Lithocarpus litseifolius]|uniref:Uncharacterized protein n=1 Tax=Lithocarpus litseifolius TaxID=425828 RepID=A0AAW2CZS0_9ROSI